MKNIFALLILTIAFASCKKKDTPPPNDPPVITSVYMPLKVGNYWIYQRYRTDMNNVNDTIYSTVTDSVFISKDTMIQGLKYYKLDRTNLSTFYVPLFMADSAGYLLSAPGVIILSPDSTETFEYDTPDYHSYERTCRKDSLVHVPAGDFHNTITFQSYKEGKMGFGSGSWYRVYAKGIGIIVRQIYYSGSVDNPEGIKLLRYKVDK